MIIINAFLFALIYPKTDISLFVVLVLIFSIGFLIRKLMLKTLSRLFKDPSKGIYIMGFLVVGPFILSLILLINSLITFESKEEKIKIIGYERQYTYKRRHGSNIIKLEENKFQYQPGFRIAESSPTSQYINYQFRRGIFGLRVLEGKYYTDN
jgi:hypothetical protein